MSMRLSRARAATTALLVPTFLMATAACESDGGTSTEGSNLTGDAIRVMASGPYTSNPISAYPEAKTGVEARVAAINDAGGINGRPIEVTYCDDKLGPTGTVECANEAVKSEVVAVIGSINVVPGMLPILEAAGIPYIGSSGYGPDEFTSAASFPVSSGGPGLLAGMGAQVARLGATKIVHIGHDAPSNGENLIALKRGLEAAGLELFRDIVAPHASKDFSAYASAAIEDGVDGITLANSPNTDPAIIKALRRAGYDGVIVMASTSDEAVKSMGDAGNGVYPISTVANAHSVAIPAVKEFRAQMDKQDPEALKDEFSLAAWTGVGLFEAIAKDLPTIDAASLLKAMSDISTPIDLGTTGPYVGSPSIAPEGYPHMYNPTVTVSEIVDGALVQQDGFLNPYVAPK